MNDDEHITKKCAKCKDEFLLDMFYQKKNGKHCRDYICKFCRRKMNNAFGVGIGHSRAQKLLIDAKKRQQYDSDVIEIMEGNDKQGMTEQDAYNLMDEMIR